MAFDRFFGFDLIQRKTLEKLLAEVGAGDTAALQDQIDALELRVEALENAEPEV